MPSLQSQKIGIQKNKLLRYKLVVDLYNRHYSPDIPITVLLRKYIYPHYPISRTTLYTILNTPIDKELKEIQAIEDAQISMF